MSRPAPNASPGSTPGSTPNATQGSAPGSTPKSTPANLGPDVPDTQQHLDPIGGLAAWPLAPVIALIVFGYSVISTVMQAAEIHTPVFAVFALLFMAVAAGALVWASLPERAPVARPVTYLLVGLGLASYLLEQASMWGQNVLIQDDFGQIGLGLLLLALAPFRPWREIALAGFAAAAVVAAGSVLQAPSLGIIVPPAIYGTVAATQLLAPALAGAAFSRHIVRSIRTWQTDARRSIAVRTEEGRGRMARSVVDARLATLGTSVLPLLNRILERGTLTAADVEQAQTLAGEVRRALVAEVDHTWLIDLVTRERLALTKQGLPAQFRVLDPDRRAVHFDAQQRAAIGALIVAICGLRGFDPASLVVQITDGAPYPDTVTIRAGIALPAAYRSARLRPYLAVLRVTFVRVRVVSAHPLLTLQFLVERPHGRAEIGDGR